MKKSILFILLSLIIIPSQAQIGGSFSFDFVNLPTNAKQIGLGAYNITASGQDVNMFLANPSLLVDSVAEKVAFSYHPYYAETNAVSLAYAHDFGKAGTWGIGVQNIGYGDFELTDDTGASMGTFEANEFLLII